MKVRATRIGYYNLERQREGSEFVLKPIEFVGKDGKHAVLSSEDQFSLKWMEKVDKEAPKATVPAQGNRPALVSGKPSGSASVI